MLEVTQRIAQELGGTSFLLVFFLADLQVRTLVRSGSVTVLFFRPEVS